MSNLWLNASLREAHAGALADPPPARRGRAAPKAAAMTADAGSRRRSGHPNRRAAAHIPQTRRRLWLRLAAALFLCGSAAFSYLAWSEVGLPGTQRSYPGAGTQSPGMPASTVAESAVPGHPESTALAAARSRVHALREENANLHQRMSTIASRLQTIQGSQQSNRD